SRDCSPSFKRLANQFAAGLTGCSKNQKSHVDFVAADFRPVLFEDYLPSVLGANDLAVLATVLVSLHLDLVGAFGLLSERIGLLLIGLDRRETGVLPQDQHVPRAAVVHGSKDLVRLLKPSLDLCIL